MILLMLFIDIKNILNHFLPSSFWFGVQVKENLNTLTFQKIGSKDLLLTDFLKKLSSRRSVNAG